MTQDPEIQRSYKTSRARQALGCKIQVQVPVLLLCALGHAEMPPLSLFLHPESKNNDPNSHSCSKFTFTDAKPFLKCLHMERGYFPSSPCNANLITKQTQSLSLR